MATPSSLPTRFPCWCRAVYSWGGESKHDIGFVEGDLIECLNAGDGSWWMGRLRRDKRVKGLFPSNFVEVLDDSFRPASRATSPMPDRSPSISPFNHQQPQKQKTKSYRKPFQAYAAPDTAKLEREEASRRASQSVSPAQTPSPGSFRNRQSGAPPREVASYGSRAPSPNPGTVRRNYQAAQPRGISRYDSGAQASISPGSVHRYDDRRQPSQDFQSYGSRSPSPNPQHFPKYHSRGPSPSPQFDLGSSPPPPAPPPHRSTYTPHQPTTPYVPQTRGGYHTPRAHSPYPPSPGGHGLTPSPLRSAMDDVMSSLADMGISRDTESPEAALNPWGPEAFEQTYQKAREKNRHRPNTAMGGYDYETYKGSDAYQDKSNAQVSQKSEPEAPQLSNYVQRMENQLNQMHAKHNRRHEDEDDAGPEVPPKTNPFERPKSMIMNDASSERKLRHRKSAYEVGRSMIGRTFTSKTTSTNSSSGARSTTTNGSASTELTDRSLMSGPSASEFSYTSAGSMARKKETYSRAHSAMGVRDDLAGFSVDRPESPFTGISYHSSHASNPPRSQSQAGWHAPAAETNGGLGGLVTPKPKKSGFFKKIIESAKTSAASARTSIAAGDSSKLAGGITNMTLNGVASVSGGGISNQSAGIASEMGLGGHSAGDWVQVRRDVNRSNSLSAIERVEMKERCQMMDYPAISSVEELYQSCDGDEDIAGNSVEEPTNFQAVNLSMVDKNSRFINGLPPTTNSVSLAMGYVCRPYRSDVQRLRAIFTWVSEKIVWEEDYDSEIDTRKVIRTKRACAEEVAVLVFEMCTAVGIQVEIVHGYLKTPGEVPEIGIIPRSNHWWNAVVIDGQWRFMDCSLSSPTHPRRSQYSGANGQTAESWWFLTRPTELCWTHIPAKYQQQHICPPVAHEILLTLPCTCPPYFKNQLEMIDYDTSLIRIEDLELLQVRFTAPADVECVAEVEARAFERDADGDFFESGETIKKRALAQAEWVGGQKRYTIKAALPGDEGQGILKIYAGKRGLLHSIRDIVHPVAFALPIVHTGDNPPYEFVTRHPTPHAQRHDLYIAQPQCQRLAVNNTFVFAVRQHPSSLPSATSSFGGISPIPFRPSSAMSMTNSSASGSNPSTTSSSAAKKPAKLAIQSPGGKILRLMRKDERSQGGSGDYGDGSTWETIIKCGETGVWRGLVLADRSARWCVFAEWVCV